MPPDNRIRPDGPCRHRVGGLRHRIPTRAASPPMTRDRARRHAGRGAAHRRRLRRDRSAREALRLPHGRASPSAPPARARSCACTGEGLKNLGEVLFFGADADEADDAAVAPRKIKRRSVLVRVPRSAVTGRLALRRVDGTRSAASEEPLTIAPGRHRASGRRRRRRSAGAQGLLRRARARVALLRRRRRARGRRSRSTWSAAATARSWRTGPRRGIVPGEPQTIEWDGTVDGKVAKQGLYRFEVTATDAAGLRATSAQSAAPSEGESPARSASSSTASRSSARTLRRGAPRRSAAAAAIRATTSSPSAARRSSPPAAG